MTLVPPVSHPREVEPGRAEDEALVARMAQGDRAALMALYDRYAPTMLAVGARILGDRREAEDLLHDVILEAWQAAGQYQPGRGKVSTWLLLRLRSRALDRVRAPSRSRTTVTDDPVPADAAAPAADPHFAADRPKLMRALAEIPPEQRRVLELAYFDGLSASEIAAELGLSIGTVKSRTAAALSKLRTRLGGGAS